MKLKLLFIVGLAVGYLLGARAGRGKYEQLKERATDAWEHPQVQRVVSDVQEFVKDNAPLVQERVVAGTKAAVAGAQDGYARAAETAKDVTAKVADTAKDVTTKVATTAREVTEKVVETSQELRGRVTDRGEDVVDGVLVTIAKARDRALEEDGDTDTGTGTGTGTDQRGTR